jgi:SAM-dependent methyltransferase
LRLFAISFLLLFAELACIRWFGSTVILLTYFTNIVLMACVLGMSVGCLAASRGRDWINAALPLFLVATALAAGTLRAYVRQELSIAAGSQESPQQIFFGAESVKTAPIGRTYPIELVAGVFFGLIALAFVGLGQVMGRAFSAIPNRIAAYTVNVLGSLAGIAGFAAASALRAPPRAWFAVALVPLLGFVTRLRLLQVPAVAAVLFLVGWTPSDEKAGATRLTWSPYYKVVFSPETGVIETNNIGHQQMVKVGNAGPAYALPHLLNRDSGGQPFRDVMIIGAGSGNDVAAALAHGARHVDAVEIDPVMAAIGRAHHPERPYDDPRVTLNLDDGRSFVRKTRRHYDLAVYALVDSLVNHSGYSSLRLENFLFTEQAFRDIQAKLKPDGVFVMYNYFRQGWVVGRLEGMVEHAFKVKPIVVSLPYRASITPAQNQGGAITMLIAGKTEAATAAIRRRLQPPDSFWVHISPKYNEDVNAFGPEPPQVAGTSSEHWRRIAPAAVETRGIGPLPSDDWPFLYLRAPRIPALNLWGMLIVAAVSLAILAWFAPPRTTHPSGRMFFLGAGFMLLETRGVVHLALLFGSTWLVNSIVFFAILVMVLLANLFVVLVRPRRLRVYYALLIASLVLAALLPLDAFLTLPGAAKAVASCAVTFVPIFFAGVIFATEFRDSRHPDVDFGSNIGGVILGGLSENLSLVVGFNHLLFLAIAYYLLSAAFSRRRS